MQPVVEFVSALESAFVELFPDACEIGGGDGIAGTITRRAPLRRATEGHPQVRETCGQARGRVRRPCHNGTGGKGRAESRGKRVIAPSLSAPQALIHGAEMAKKGHECRNQND